MRRSFLFLCLTLTTCVALSAQKNTTKSAYSEPHRPQFHFSPPAKWMNDPNGMFYYKGEYHLFYQYYPDSTVWGPMHWGHAVSRNLRRWEHLPVALYPDSLGYIFSGSAVVDWKNTSGFGKNGQPPIVAIYTYHNMAGEKSGRSDFQYQGIAYSNDNGRTWTKYAANPVIPNKENIRDFRDPKVRWDDVSGQWVLVLAAQNHVRFYGSQDLKNWKFLSDFGREWGSHGGVWECPDLFPVKVEGSTEKKWVLLVSINPGAPNGGSGTQYFVGNFDGKSFTPDQSFTASIQNEQGVWLDYGRDNYAGVTWSDVPAKDGRRLFMGWMSNWDYATVVPTDTWRSAMTLPRELKLKTTSAGYRLFSTPVRELGSLKKESTYALTPVQLSGEQDITKETGFADGLLEMVIEFRPDAAAEFGIELSNTRGERYRIGYNAQTKQFFSDRTQAGDASFSPKFADRVHTAPRLSGDPTVALHLFFDVASAELFADNGATVMTDIFFPKEKFTRMKMYSRNGKTDVVVGRAWGLKRIWR